jgi:hypothetical protein
MNTYLKATTGWAYKSKHVEILKQITIDDLDIEWDEPYWSKHGNTWSRSMRMTVDGIAGDEITTIWEEELAGSYGSFPRPVSPLTTSHTFSHKVFLQGCSGATRDNKIAEGKHHLFVMCEAEQDAIIENGLTILKNAICRLASNDNGEYERQHFDALTNSPKWIDESANVSEDLQALQDLEQRTKALRDTIRHKRNVAALQEFELEGWNIVTSEQTFPLVGSVVRKLQEAYSNDAAFETGLFGRH